MKKLIIFILLFTSIVYSQPFDSGTGVYNDPYMISTPEQLDSMRNYCTINATGNFFELANDIDMSGYTWLSIPVFIGQLNGGFNAIRNFNKLDTMGVGPINNEKGGFINDAKYSTSSVSAWHDSLQFAIGNIKFEDCSWTVTGSYTLSTNAFAGFIVGDLQSSSIHANMNDYTDFYQVLVENMDVVMDYSVTRNFSVGVILGNKSSVTTVKSYLYRCGIDGLTMDITRTGGYYSSRWHRISPMIGYSTAFPATNAYPAGTIRNVVGECFVKNATIDVDWGANYEGHIGAMIGSMPECYGSVTRTDSASIVRNSYSRIDRVTTTGTYGSKFNFAGIAGRADGQTSASAIFQEYSVSDSYTFIDTISGGYTSAGHIWGVIASDTPDSTHPSNIYAYATPNNDYDNISAGPVIKATDDTTLTAWYSSISDFADTNNFDFAWDTVWTMKSGFPELQWVDGFGYVSIDNPRGDLTELYRIGDSVLVSWITSGVNDSSYIYADGSLVDSSDSPYYWISDLVDTVNIKVSLMSDTGLKDSADVYLYDTLFSYITITSVANDSVTFISAGVDSVYYYYSLDSNLWVWIDQVYVTELGFVDTTQFAMAQYNWGESPDTVYIRVREVALTEPYWVGVAPDVDFTTVPISQTYCNHYDLSSSGTTRQVIDASCGWVGGYEPTYRVTGDPAYIEGEFDVPYSEFITDGIGSSCPPGTYYNLSCSDWFVDNPNTWTPVGSGDSIYFAGRYYFTDVALSTDSVLCYDPLNDTTYFFYDKNNISNSDEHPYLYMHAYTDFIYSQESFLMFSTTGVEGDDRGWFGFAGNVNANMPVDEDKVLAEDVDIITGSFFTDIRDYFRGYYPKMLR